MAAEQEPRFIIGRNAYLQACAKWGKKAVDEALENNNFVVDVPYDPSTKDLLRRLTDNANSGRWMAL